MNNKIRKIKARSIWLQLDQLFIVGLADIGNYA